MNITQNELKQTIYILISRHFNVTPVEIKGDETLANAFDADSLDLVELAHSIEENLSVTIPESDFDTLLSNATPNSLIAYCTKNMRDIQIVPKQPQNKLLARIFKKFKNRVK